MIFGEGVEAGGFIFQKNMNKHWNIENRRKIVETNLKVMCVLEKKQPM